MQGCFSSVNGKLSRGVDLLRRIDRENDQYDEVVKDKNTNKIIRECHEPLGQHTGRGSAKKPKTNPKRYL